MGGWSEPMVNIKHILDEKTRREILNKEKETQARITRSQQYSVSNVVIDPDAFMNNWCVIKGIVHRPGHAYETVIAFQNVFTDLVQVAKQTSGHGVNAHLIQKSLKQSLDRNDIYLDCQCPDFKYRYAYHSTQGKFKWGKLQYSNGKKIRNPNNDIGSTCKHLYALLISMLLQV